MTGAGRYHRCRLALLVAPGGLASTVRTLQLRKAENDMLVVRIGPGDLDALVRRQDRSDALKEMHRRAVVAAFERKDDGEAPPGS